MWPGGTSAYICAPGSSVKPAALETIFDICPLVMLACGLNVPSGNPESTALHARHLMYVKKAFPSGTSGNLMLQVWGVPVAVLMAVPVARAVPVMNIVGEAVAVLVAVLAAVAVAGLGVVVGVSVAVDVSV